jgi:hypothetical protein
MSFPVAGTKRKGRNKSMSYALMSYALLDETFPIARKKHRCIWCGQPVEIGEKYRREKSVYDGNMQDFKWHLECHEGAREHFRHEEEFDAYDNERPGKLSQQHPERMEGGV